MHSRPYGERGAEWSLNADGTVVTGVDDEPASEQADPVDAAIERLNRMRPQELFETFADMELAWGPTWSGSLKSLWLGEGEAIGDIVVGEELAEHLGTEPMHPVLMDLCTGVAFPAFPALLAAEQGVNDLFLPLRYGQVMLREKMPRRFYCRAQVAHQRARQRDPGLRPRFRRSGWPPAGRDSRVHGQTRAARGVAARARRRRHPAAVHPRLARGAAAAVERRRRKCERHLADRRIRRAGRQGAGLHPVRPDHRSGAPGTAAGHRLKSAGCRSPASSGAAPRRAQRSRAPKSPRGSRPRSPTCSAPCTPCRAARQVKLPGGLWIVTERAVATESGEPVDPVQAALWGFGRTTINEEPALRCRLVDCDGSPEAVQRTGEPARHTGRRARTRAATRKAAGLAVTAVGAQRSSHRAASTDYVLAPTERGAIDNLRLTETDVPPPDEGYVQVRVEAAGLNFRDVLNVLGLYPGDPGPIGGDFAGIVTAIG